MTNITLAKSVKKYISHNLLERRISWMRRKIGSLENSVQS
jgi:hypothetical protein